MPEEANSSDTIKRKQSNTMNQHQDGQMDIATNQPTQNIQMQHYTSATTKTVQSYKIIKLSNL